MRGITKIGGALAALALVAAPLAAQGGPPGGQRPAMGRGMMQGGPAEMARNPATVVLEHREVLELTDEQVEALEAIQARIEEQNGPRWAQLEEAFGDADPAELTVEERQALRERMRELAPVRDSIRQTNRTLMAGFHEMLTEDQEVGLRRIMRRSMRNPRGARGAVRPGMRGGGMGPGAQMVGSAYMSGFRAGMARGAAACRMGRVGPGGG